VLAPAGQRRPGALFLVCVQAVQGRGFPSPLLGPRVSDSSPAIPPEAASHLCLSVVHAGNLQVDSLFSRKTDPGFSQQPLPQLPVSFGCLVPVMLPHSTGCRLRWLSCLRCPQLGTPLHVPGDLLHLTEQISFDLLSLFSTLPNGPAEEGRAASPCTDPLSLGVFTRLAWSLQGLLDRPPTPAGSCPSQAGVWACFGALAHQFFCSQEPSGEGLGMRVLRFDESCVVWFHLFLGVGSSSRVLFT
jgi:hypothetical protein